MSHEARVIRPAPRIRLFVPRLELEMGNWRKVPLLTKSTLWYLFILALIVLMGWAAAYLLPMIHG